MLTSSLLFEAYSPHYPPGDWQIIVAVNPRKRRISVERSHSSDGQHSQSHYQEHKIFIGTGIRAFRRQMPVLATALEKIDIGGMPTGAVVDSIFDVLGKLYGASFGSVQFINGSHGDTGTELADFLRQSRAKVLADLGIPDR